MDGGSAAAEIVTEGNYRTTRFNALRHGVLSRHTVLPWEDGAQYQALLSALVKEHAPEGPTEEHLVEELAGIFWRKRRLRMAEASVYREKLRQLASGYSGPHQLARAALLGKSEDTAIPQAIHDQALGVAYAGDGLDLPARYEIRLDRKLERMLAMLLRLRELRAPTVA